MLTDRQSKILKAIIDRYTVDEQPVGSKALAELADINASSATIRAEMARLEKLGMLTKTHSSSGRLPDDLGYRYYINYILPKQGGMIDEDLSPDALAELRQIFSSPFVEMTDVMLKAADVMADLTQYVAIALGPAMDNHRLARFQVVQVTSDKAMAIMVTDKNMVESQVFQLDDEISFAQIEDMVQAINQALVGKPLVEVILELQNNARRFFTDNYSDVFYENNIFNYLLKKIEGDRLRIRGRENLFNQLANSNDYLQIKKINQLLDQPQYLVSVLEPPQDGIQIQVGGELGNDNFDNLSIISMRLNLGKKDKDMIFAVLGPDNMSYLKLAQLLQSFRREMFRFENGKS
ncbi:hypothetical protein AWM75_01870 [Aerococcus urinaehominis]|uniref:Heat-inducible transcription repressor HrcA n=1 Tax=Aerococcus urinaehominis TaxID=128944 RepID=A0A109RGA1_9LACT|nr:heat-inducible transcriptional repressor HrcA [Aerococcus urinaehominis]AMB98815.1 hypothetical protein AWM75_01870 [Aerococcus urinaehominis]SDM49197.1 heat-inducible transcription repressor HrcA [Aerococcus urinaehominis]